ncbi:MAG TPA: TIGR04100 family radical SAM protein [Candidatus Ornithomonoglobus intestinigallinarum]|uniref:TIGR04100 family radical SAM protein n=1 Tax=Candidatus Ornithomonoglobus intestinigallinarum TaxID=2840894 RepID=A0A9D1H575_9FIRM|nr:TIGR04100 family radical SAM protein [Candidatus Ornithomonoglobus intestinigallinarum]
MVILYEVHSGLYVNLTNRCPCACTFCLRNEKDELNNSGSLWLEREPTLDEIKAEFDKFDMTKYKEVVFCGFGEPTERLDDMLGAAAFVKEKFGLPTRVNTNGLGDLINGFDTAPLYKGKIDTVSISLNTPDAARYLENVRPKFGEGSFEAMLKFAGNVKNYVGTVVMTTVSGTITNEEEERCRRLCEKLGVKYRIREFE